jgi:capsular exopolysaccharide synthesis family protein
MDFRKFQLENISPTCLIKHLIKNAWMIITSFIILSLSVSLVLSWFHTPVYKADMTYAINSRKTSYSSSTNVTSAREVASVMAEMLESGVVLNNIRASSDKLSDFSGTVTAKQVGESNLIIITVTDPSPEKAVTALLSLQDIFPTVTGYISSNSVVQLIRNPNVYSNPVNAVNSTRLARMAGLAGALAMAAIICWFVIQQETIQTRSGARNLLDAPIIAAVCQEDSRHILKKLFKKEKQALQVFSPTISFSYTEQINAICAKMEQEATTHGSKIFLVAGTGENEGKSTIAGNVAAALSMRGKRVALLDCDLRNPSLSKFFDNKYSAPMPLNKLLAEPFSKNHLLDCMQRHDKLGIFMLFPISQDRRCTELLSNATMDTLLKQLRVFDFVLLDTPPMGYFVDAEALAEKADASMLVVRQDCTPAAQINDTVDILKSCKARFLGCILNDITFSLTEGYGGYGHYGYGYGYGYGHYGYGYGRRHDKSHSRHKHSAANKKGG